MNKRYNGWTNYETWCVKLWLDNEEASARYWQGQAEERLHYRHRNTPEQAAWQLAEQLKDEVNEAAPDLGASCYADLLNAALGEVDWLEIATAYVEEASKALAD